MFGVYSSRAVSLIVCAIPITEGLAENFVKISPDEEAFGVAKGSDGSACRYETNNEVYNVEVTLQRSSPHNAQLAAIHAADRISKAGAGVGVFLLEDANGSTLYAGDKCWIEKLPDWEFGKGVGDVTWPLKVIIPHGAALPGGNSDPT